MITPLSLCFLLGIASFRPVALILSAPPSKPSAKKSANPYRLMRAKTFSFDAVVWEYKTGDDGKPKLTKSLTMSVKAAQPGSLRIEKPKPRPVRINATNYRIEIRGDDLFVSDGKTQYSFWKTTGECLVEKAKPRLDMYENFASNLSYPELLFTKDPIHEFDLRPKGETILNGQPVLTYEGTTGGGEGKFLFYIAKKTGLPMQLSEFDKDDKGNWIEGMRTRYVNWKVNPKFPASTFDTTPPPGAKMVTPKAPGK